jgi:hypothetical protein
MSELRRASEAMVQAREAFANALERYFSEWENEHDGQRHPGREGGNWTDCDPGCVRFPDRPKFEWDASETSVTITMVRREDSAQQVSYQGLTPAQAVALENAASKAGST